jgi:hypothetical protein
MSRNKFSYSLALPCGGAVDDELELAVDRLYVARRQ